MRLSGLLGCFTKGLTGLFHLGLEGLARLLPGFLLEGHATRALALAGVLSRIFPTPPLPFARIIPFARVGFRRGAFARARAGIISAFALAFASIEAATDVLILQQQRRIMFVAVFRAPGNRRAQEHAAKSGHGQFSKIAPRQVCILNKFSIVHVSSSFFG